METRDGVDPQPAASGLGSIDPAKLWLLGLAVDDDGSIAGPGLRRYSFWAACECPGDCNRDHENE